MEHGLSRCFLFQGSFNCIDALKTTVVCNENFSLLCIYEYLGSAS